MDESKNAVVWRSGKQLGAAVRAARERKGLTQADLARQAEVGLKFLYELESGKDTLRADKVLDVLDVLALELLVTPRGSAATRERLSAATRATAPQVRQTHAQYGTGAAPTLPQIDYVGMACTTAGVSLRKTLAPDELIRALLTGKATPGKHAHFIVLIEEAPVELLQGLVAQVGVWSTPAIAAKNLRKIAAALGVRLKITA